MTEKELDRRAFLRWTAAAGMGAMIAPQVFGAPASQPAAVQMARFPQKRDLILLTDRPPNLETPIGYFRQDLTPNDAFFVRWHHAGVPTSVDPRTFRLSVKGHVATPLELSLAELREK